MLNQLNKEEAEALLRDHHFGHLGCNDGFNTFVYPTNYVYDGIYIFCHAVPGAKILVMEHNNRVCLQVEDIRDQNNWKSVMVLGNYSELEDERDRYYAMKLFNSRMLQPKFGTNHTFHPNDEESQLHLRQKSRPVIFRISIEELTGRYESALN